jgi:osmotically-inducible protein OsmY
MRSATKTYEGLMRIFSLAAACLVVMASTGRAVAQELTDTEITNAVEDELLFDKSVDLNDIDVKTTQGVVTLSGVVSNILAKERAAKLTRTIKGVRSVVNRIKVSPSPLRSDTAILHDVQTALLRDPATKAYAVYVAVRDNEVTLTGNVGSWQQKRLAEKVVKGVRGVKEVENNIDVTYSTTRRDAQIEDEIQKALRWDTLVDDGLVQVDVEDGKVELTGTVGSAAEKARVSIDAWVTGVKSIDDSGLKVRKWARDPTMRKGKYVYKPDDKIKEAIKDALLYDPRVASFNVTPVVDKGVVTLRGVVDNLKAKRAAKNVARRTVGVTTVRNRIKVRPEAPSDSEIAANVRKAIKRDPYLQKKEITVSVVAGTAHLFGSVDSYFEKGRADDIASRSYGVTEVDNALQVETPKHPLAYDPYIYDDYMYDEEWYDYEPYRTFKTDQQIKRAVRSHMWWSPYIDREDVNVTVEKGVVTLKGRVDTWNEWFAAMEEAYEGGATWVYNRLEVK